MDLLRFTTSGSIDDGKSTLIGRLLNDTGNVKSDVLESVSTDEQTVNLAHITDGLRSEREGGITIDIGYKYFSTAYRKYIISDAPGHFQYTKNMVTGASQVDVIIILIDARNGITAQTRLHSLVASFLKVKHVLVAVNKMDCVNYDEQVFNKIKDEFNRIAERLQIQQVQYIPISALVGDNITSNSGNMGWYNGVTLLDFLEQCEIEAIPATNSTRFSVQYVSQSDNATLCYGRLLSGKLHQGEVVSSYPSREKHTIHQIIAGDREIATAQTGSNLCLIMEITDHPKRGDIISTEEIPLQGNDIEIYLCWMDDAELVIGKEYLLRLNSLETPCTITEIMYKTDSNTFEAYNDGRSLQVNQFAKVSVKTKKTIVYDHHSVLPGNARGILINITTNETIGAFIID